jgi:hypothetical protein
MTQAGVAAAADGGKRHVRACAPVRPVPAAATSATSIPPPISYCSHPFSSTPASHARTDPGLRNVDIACHNHSLTSLRMKSELIPLGTSQQLDCRTQHRWGMKRIRRTSSRMAGRRYGPLGLRSRVRSLADAWLTRLLTTNARCADGYPIRFAVSKLMHYVKEPCICARSCAYVCLGLCCINPRSAGRFTGDA